MRGEGGTIVNVSSILGERVSKGLAAYAASKAGLIQLTKALALEWAAFDIRVNALAPGYIETDLNRDFFASDAGQRLIRSEEHTSELQSLMRISYAVFCLKTKKQKTN